MNTKPKPAPAPRPSAPAPTRPPMRTPPARIAPKPQNIPTPDVGGVMRRGFARGLGAVVGALWPDPLNVGEEAWLGNPNVRHNELSRPPRGLASVDEKTGRVVVGPDREVWTPPQYRVPTPSGPDAPLVRAPDGSPIAKGGARTGYRSRPLERDEYDPFGEDAFYGGFTDHLPESVYRNDPAPRRGVILLPGRNPVSVPRPVGDPLPAAPGMPAGDWVRWPVRQVYQPSLTVTVEDTVDGPQVRFRVRPVREVNIASPRYRDTKFGKRLVGVLNHLVTATWGVVSELEDAAEVFSWSLYGMKDGRVVPAMLMENRSMAASLKGYLEGEYRLDAAGFAMDFAINQVEDFAYGQLSRAQLAATQKALGESLGYKVNRQLGWAQRMEGNSHVQPLVSSATQWMGSFDSQRRARVRGLWS